MVDVAVEEEALASEWKHVPERGDALHRRLPVRKPSSSIERIDVGHVPLPNLQRRDATRDEPRILELLVELGKPLAARKIDPTAPSAFGHLDTEHRLSSPFEGRRVVGKLRD